MSDLKILKETKLEAFKDNQKLIQLTQYEHGESGVKCYLFDSQRQPIDLADCLQANYWGTKSDDIGIECRVEDNAVIIPVILPITATPGRIKGVLECVFDNGNIRFYGVNFVIGESPNVEKIESTDDFTVLEKSIAEVQELLKFADTKLDKPTTDGTAGQVLTLADDGTTQWTTPTGGGGSGGTTDYADLANKPKINGVELNGDIKPSDLGIKDGEDYVLSEDDKQEIVKDVLSQVNTETGASGDVLLIDFTTTEEVEMIDIPLTDDIIEQINNSAKLILILEMGMPEEGNTGEKRLGKITTSFYDTANRYNQNNFFSNLEIAPTNSISYINLTRTVAIFEKIQASFPTIVNWCVYRANGSGNFSSSQGTNFNSSWRDVFNKVVLRILSEIPTAVGTNIKLYQRGVLE